MDLRHPRQTLNSRLPLKLGSDRRETLPKRVSDDPQHFIFRRTTKSQTLTGCLPPEDSSDRPETWPKRVADDSKHFIFRP